MGDAFVHEFLRIVESGMVTIQAEELDCSTFVVKHFQKRLSAKEISQRLEKLRCTHLEGTHIEGLSPTTSSTSH